MSFVSRILERIGVLAPATTATAATAPPAVEDSLDEATEERLAAEVAAARTRPFELDEPTHFDPEMTQRSLEPPEDEPLEEAAEVTDLRLERTAVGAAPEVTAVSPGEATPAPRRVTLAELLAHRGLVARDGPSPAEVAARRGLDASFDQVFAAAGLGPSPNGWTVDRAREVVRRGRAEGMTPAQVRFLLEEALVRDGATPRDIAADAVAKDEALDAYELALAARVASAEREGEAEAEALAQKILDLQARRREALDQIAERRTRLAAWRARKADAEREWADVLEVLAPFLTVADG